MMENKIETTIMENQMEKKMENDMETREHLGLYRGYRQYDSHSSA